MIWLDTIGPNCDPGPSRVSVRTASIEANRLVGSRSRQVCYWSRRIHINRRLSPTENGITIGSDTHTHSPEIVKTSVYYTYGSVWQIKE
jgi:hypothetical protein